MLNVEVRERCGYFDFKQTSTLFNDIAAVTANALLSRGVLV